MPSNRLAIALEILKAAVLDLIASELAVLSEFYVSDSPSVIDDEVECHGILVEGQHQIGISSLDVLAGYNRCESVASGARSGNLDVADSTYIVYHNSVVVSAAIDCHCGLRRCAVSPAH